MHEATTLTYFNMIFPAVMLGAGLLFGHWWMKRKMNHGMIRNQKYGENN